MFRASDEAPLSSVYPQMISPVSGGFKGGQSPIGAQFFLLQKAVFSV